MMFPKPTKKSRVARENQRKAELAAYRRSQAALAIDRDGNQCIFCHFLDGGYGPREDVHHVFGRGSAAGDWREQYANLACTCRKHHPQPIKIPGSSKNLGWVEEVLKMANEHPINKSFHVERS
jgi:hypothetical protein